MMRNESRDMEWLHRRAREERRRRWLAAASNAAGLALGVVGAMLAIALLAFGVITAVRFAWAASGWVLP